MGKRGPKKEMISEELNEKRKKRIWELLRGIGLNTQIEVAQFLYSFEEGAKTTENSNPNQQKISRQIGKKGTVTKWFCEDVHKKFPEYSLEYIKGESPYKTKEEEALWKPLIQEHEKMLEDAHRDGVMINKSITALGRFSGFQFDFDKSKDPFDADTFVTITNTNNDGLWQLSVDEWGNLQKQICDYIEFAIKHLPSITQK